MTLLDHAIARSFRNICEITVKTKREVHVLCTLHVRVHVCMQRVVLVISLSSRYYNFMIRRRAEGHMRHLVL